MVAILAIVFALEFFNDYIRWDRPAFSLAAVGLLVTSLSIFLVFRVNESFGRWWEARQLWGNLVNASRSFARQATTLIEGGESEGERVRTLHRDLVYRQIAFANALRLSLRQQDDWQQIEQLLHHEEFSQLAHAVNKPTFLLQRQGEQLASAAADGLLSELGRNQFDRTLLELHNVQGSCERIKTTPFPEKIAYYSRVIAWVMAITGAIAIMDTDNHFDLVDMIVVPVLMFSFVLIERLGAELRNPFDNAPADVPMTALCRTIERDLRQVLGEEEIPPMPEAENGVLM